MFKNKSSETTLESQTKEIKAPSPTSSCDGGEAVEPQGAYITRNVPIIGVPSDEEIKAEKV